MVSRRATLALLGSGLTGALGGCLAGQGTPTETSRTWTHSPTPASDDPDATPDSNTPPDGWPPAKWTLDWTHDVPVSHVVGLDVVDGRLIITANDNPGDTVVQSYDPGARSVRWSREFPGEAITNSTLPRAQVSRGWGVTDAGDTLLSVTGRDTDRKWMELHAIDPETGESRWSLRRERTLAVRGLVDGTIYVLARAFDETPTEHYHGSDTPTPEPIAAGLLAVDLADGSVRWRREFTGVGAVAADDAGVYVAVMNRLLGFDHGGNRQWTVRGDSRGKAIFPGPEVVYHVAKPEWDQMVVRGVGHDGTVRWHRQFSADESVRHRDRLYVAGDRLSTVRPDGSLAWRSSGWAGRLTFAPASDRVYVRTGRQADAVGAVALGDGSRQWTFDPPITNAWPESATDETVVAGAIGETAAGVGQPLYRVDAATGEATARYLAADPITTQPLGDHVFVGIGRYEEGGQVLALPL